MKEGESLSIQGPLGNGYDVNATYASKDAIIFGGGIGIPPMLELAKQLNCKKQIVLGYKDELFLNEEFEKSKSKSEAEISEKAKKDLVFATILPFCNYM